MKTSVKLSGTLCAIGISAAVGIFALTGCATKEYVGQQITPVADRVTQTEGRIGQTEGQIAKLGDRATASEGKISKIEGDLGKVDAKAERALAGFGNLKFERRLTIDMKGSTATFGFNSSTLSDEAKQKIDEFLGGLKSDLANAETSVFLVTGHTDNKGSEDVNFELGKRRADIVGRYLITQKKIDPLRVITVSYGDTSPVADNKTRDGRATNRRVEILVYRETINSNAGTIQQQK
jgi:outer membrane protein OmpA-like peptidoglycan-associated protein